MTMRILHVDTGNEADTSIEEFRRSLNVESLGTVKDAQEIKCKDLLAKTATQECIFLLVHGLPAANTVRTWANCQANIIHIALSVSAPSLSVGAEYSQGVAAFSWPFKAGTGLGDLGLFVRAKLNAQQGEDESAHALAAVKEYFATRLDNRSLIAAYLLRKLYSDVQYEQQVESLGLEMQYSKLTLAQLEGQLKSRIQS